MQPRAIQLSLPLDTANSAASEVIVTQPIQSDERVGPGDRRREDVPGMAPVGRAGIILSALYLAVLSTMLIYVLVGIWPEPEQKLGAFAKPNTPGGDSVALAAAKAYWGCDSTGRVVTRWKSDSTVRDPKCVRFARQHVLMWDEQRLLLMVLIGGALGALLHALRSFYMYVGNRKLRNSWLLMYALLPISGSLLALVFYVVIRGGFFAANTGTGVTSPFAFIAMAVMVGLFSQVASEKLKQVAESFFTKTPTAADSLAGEGTAVLRRAQRVATSTGGPRDAIDIEGEGFTEGTRLDINGHEKKPEVQGANRLRVLLDAAELAALENGGELSVQIKNGDKNSSSALTVS